MHFLYFIQVLIGIHHFYVDAQPMSAGACDPMRCLEQARIQNVFLRQDEGGELPPTVICDIQSPNSLFSLITCWRRQCGENYGGNPTMLNAERTINDICLGEARSKLPIALQQCRIYYPSVQARPLPPDLANQCTSTTPLRAGSDRAPAIEARIANFFSTYSSFADQELAGQQPPFLEDPNMTVDLSANGRPRGRPIVGTDVIEDSDAAWQWPAAASSPNFPMVFPYSTLPYGGTGQQNLLVCLQISDLMDCTLARTCGPDLGQVLKSLAMVYLGCSAVGINSGVSQGMFPGFRPPTGLFVYRVRTSAVCEVNRVRYCMRVSGGNIFDVFDPLRRVAYCQNFRAILTCIDKDCPPNAAGNADIRLLGQYKSFLQKFCLDSVYQENVVRGSVNCPIFQGAVEFPATTRSMDCAKQLMARQPAVLQPNLCTIVEANGYCLARDRQCAYEDFNPQKTALLDMIGCNPAGVIQNDIIPNLSNLLNRTTIIRSSWNLAVATAFLLFFAIVI